MYAGFVIDELSAARDFYTSKLGFEVTFAAEWFILLTRGDNQIGFMKPGVEFVAPVFRSRFGGGAWVAVEVEDVDAVYAELRERVEIAAPLTTESWGERHFVIVDPQGIALDFVQLVASPGSSTSSSGAGAGRA